MAYLNQMLGGIGRSRVVILDSGGRTVYAYTFPLCQQDGFYRQWIPEGFDHKLIGLDITDPVVYEVPYEIGFWIYADLDFSGMPVPIAVAEAIKNIKNNVGRAGVNNIIRVYPKYDSFPNDYFTANLVREPYTIRVIDNAVSTGTYGLRIAFKSVQTVSQIEIEGVIPPSEYATAVDDTGKVELIA